MIKTAKELVAACLDVVDNYKTIYVLSCFGAPMNAKNKERYAKADPKRADKIRAASDDTFGFDCVCFIKGLFWGWCGNVNHVYGGAEYKSGGVPDMSADAIIKACTDVSEDFSNIVPGELVWLPGHVGIYVGDGLAAESTFEPESGVQLQCVLPMGVKPGMPATGWVKHGRLPWISYVEEKPKEESEESGNLNISLRQIDGSSHGDDVRAMQVLLDANGCRGKMNPTLYGSSGKNTVASIKTFQQKNSLPITGVCDKKTWEKLLGV